MNNMSAEPDYFKPPFLGRFALNSKDDVALQGMGFWEQEIASGKTFCSDSIYRMVGVDPEAGRQERDFWVRRVHPDDLLAQEEAYLAFARGKSSTLEEIYRVRHENGHWAWVLARARRVDPDAPADEMKLMGYVVDVTARHTEFDLLRKREERFRLSLSALRGLVYDRDLITAKTVRHGLKQMLGYEDLPDVDGHSAWMDVVHPEDRERVAAAFRASRESGKNFEMTYRIRHRDGRLMNVLHRGTFNIGSDGRAIRSFGLVEDITETEHQRNQLQLQANIIERMSEGVMLLDRQGLIQFANPALERLFRYDTGVLRGRDACVLSFRTPANFQRLVDAVFNGTENGKMSVIDLDARRRDGTLCPIQAHFSRMVYGDRDCIICVFNDNSERKELEREVLQVATRIQQRIGGDLHDEVGQQLAGIAMMLQGLVSAGGFKKPGLRADLEKIVELVNAATRSTRSLARGLSPVREGREGLIEGFHELVQQMSGRFTARVDMDLQLPQDLELSEDTATNLYRIAQEGVYNALRHAQADTVQVQMKVIGTDIDLLVSDNGKGFDPSRVARGMGLRIMRFRAQMIGGYVAVESRPGVGTTLRCSCLLKREEAAA
ncbi:MAG: PAS domain-containing protein [Pseudomonadota bacterium]